MSSLTVWFQSRKVRVAVFATLYVLLLLFFAWIFYAVFIQQDEPISIGNINVPPGQLPNINGQVPGNFNANGNLNLPPTGELPKIDEVANGGRTLVKTGVEYPVGKARISGTNLDYYNEFDGKFYRIGPDGNPILLSDTFFPNASLIQFSPTQNQAIMTFPDGTTILYDFDAETQATLSEQMNEIRFSSDGAQIGFEFYGGNSDENFLGVSNPDGTGMKAVEAVADRGSDFSVNWSPNKQVVATFRDAVGANQQEIFFVGQNNENFKSMIVDGRGFEGIWTPSGNQIVYSVYSSDTDYQPSLFVVEASGDRVGASRLSLGVRTFVEKCTFSSSSMLYCAVPSTMPEGAGLNRKLLSGVPDVFYKIDITTGNVTFLANPVNAFGNRSFVAREVFVNGDESRLYFINDLTGALEYIALQ
ncbi:MAG: hypothetical protein HYZ08_02995 [Candidatus Kerfeldbacteria bacterium]|nr:hypothetical protein [Candidatus Kerfeldbacteria bacterium]